MMYDSVACPCYYFPANIAPPSIRNSSPVINEAESLIKNSIAAV